MSALDNWLVMVSDNFLHPVGLCLSEFLGTGLLPRASPSIQASAAPGPVGPGSLRECITALLCRQLQTDSAWPVNKIGIPVPGFKAFCLCLCCARPVSRMTPCSYQVGILSSLAVSPYLLACLGHPTLLQVCVLASFKARPTRPVVSAEWPRYLSSPPGCFSCLP